MKGYIFDIQKFIRDLGGPTAVHRKLNALGFDVKLGTVKKWRERGDIAVPYLVNLFAYEAFFGEGPIDMNRYIEAGKELRAPRRPLLPTAAAPQPSPRARATPRG